MFSIVRVLIERVLAVSFVPVQNANTLPTHKDLGKREGKDLRNQLKAQHDPNRLGFLSGIRE